MGIFNKKAESTFDEPQSELATRLGLSKNEIEKLSVGKSCPKYGTSEILHMRKVRGGKVIVFNISEKYRGEKISEGRKKIKAQKLSADESVDEKDKK